MRISPFVSSSVNTQHGPARFKSIFKTDFALRLQTSGDKANGFKIYEDYQKVKDEEKVYTFKPDGSASCQSCAWGAKTECPAGTFSDLYAKLPNTATEIKPELAKQMIDLYKTKMFLTTRTF